MEVSEQIAQAVREWELDTGLSYHYNTDNPESNKGAITKHGWKIKDHTIPLESTLAKPNKFVAILSHKYTPAALNEGLHTLKGCDHVLANLLDAARQISTTHKGLVTLAELRRRCCATLTPKTCKTSLSPSTKSLSAASAENRNPESATPTTLPLPPPLPPMAHLRPPYPVRLKSPTYLTCS